MSEFAKSCLTRSAGFLFIINSVANKIIIIIIIMKNVLSSYMNLSLTRCLRCANTTSEWASSSDLPFCTVSGITCKSQVLSYATGIINT